MLRKEIILENQPIDPDGKHEYQARLIIGDNKFKWTLVFFIKRSDGWGPTPGQWYVTTIIENTDGDILYIDAGQKWFVKNIKNIRSEILEKIGNDIEIELEIRAEQEIENRKQFLERKMIDDFEREP